MTPPKNKELINEVDAIVDKHMKDLYKKVGGDMANGFSMISELGKGWTQQLSKTNKKVEELDKRLGTIEFIVRNRAAFWLIGFLLVGLLVVIVI